MSMRKAVGPETFLQCSWQTPARKPFILAKAVSLAYLLRVAGLLHFVFSREDESTPCAFEAGQAASCEMLSIPLDAAVGQYRVEKQLFVLGDSDTRTIFALFQVVP